MLKKGLERLAGNDFNQSTQNVRRESVFPSHAGLMHQGKPCQAANVLGQRVLGGSDAIADSRVGVEPGDIRSVPEALTKPGSVIQQVADCDRPVSRHDLEVVIWLARGAF